MDMAVHSGEYIFNPHSVILYVFIYTGIKPEEPHPAHLSISCLSLVPEFLQEGFVPSVSSVQTVDRQCDLIKQGRDVKKSTTVLDFMDY